MSLTALFTHISAKSPRKSLRGEIIRLKRVKISLTICYSNIGLPEKSYSNEEIASKYSLDTSDEWISTRTGIKARHLCEEEDLLSMCIKACSGIEKMRDEISILVVATSTNRKYFPSVAAYLHGALGLNRSVVAFDVNDACNGFIQALQIARSLILNTGKSALVVGADEMSRFLDWKDRSTCVLFGDAAGSIIIRDNPKKVYKQTNYTLSQYNDLFQINPNFKMEGKTVFKMAVESMIEDAKDIIKDIDINRIKYFIPHQANERITKLVNESLAMNTVNNIKYTGNTNAATIPLALNSIYENLKPGDFALMTAFGAGLRGGSVLIEM